MPIRTSLPSLSLALLLACQPTPVPQSPAPEPAPAGSCEGATHRLKAALVEASGRCWRDAQCAVFQSFYPVRADHLPALNKLGQEARAACHQPEGAHPDLGTGVVCVSFRCQFEGVQFRAGATPAQAPTSP
jgi:hypothetical protein